MHVKVIIGPDPLVTWEEAKAALNIDDDDDQSYVELLIAAASAFIDGPDGCLGKSLNQQTLEARLDDFDSADIKLPCGPVTSIVSVKYLDAAGVEQTVETGVYDLALWTGSVHLRSDSSWPSVGYMPEAVRIMYEAGFDDVPVQAKQAALLLVGHWYANREAVNVGNIVTTLPLGVEALLSTLRSWA